jgi:hypothetical protein
MANHDNYVIQGSSLDAIANEVKILSDTSDKMTVDEITSNLNQANTDVETQADLIAQIKTALKGKAVGDGIGIEEAISQFATYDFTADHLVLTCNSVRPYLFIYMNNITRLDFPNAETIGSEAFESMAGLTSVRFKNVKSIGQSAFMFCELLDKVIIETQADGDITSDTLPPCSIEDASVFSSTPIDSWSGGIYVPQNLVDVYTNGTNWSSFPIYSIEENLELLSAEYPDLAERYGGNEV